MSKNTERIEELKREIAKLEAEDKKFAGMTVQEKIATIIHSATCILSHEDMCGWWHEEEWPDKWSNDKSTHYQFLRRAERVVWEARQVMPTIANDSLVELVRICFTVR